MKQIMVCLLCVLILACQSKTENQNNKTMEKHEAPTLTEETATYETTETPLDTLLNTNDYLILGKSTTKVKVVKEAEIGNFPTFEILIRYRDDVIIGEDATNSDLKLYRKYNLKTAFKDYEVPVYDGKLADPDFSSYPNAKRFITRIKAGCEDGINFAGHYTLVTWGCGTSCQSGVVVDRKTGAIYGGYQSALGSEFKTDSKMIVKNIAAIDTTTNLIEICHYCAVHHEIWTGTAFKEVE